MSVVIPTYNRATMLRRAIQSVLDQTFGDLEVIVVDDCSTDDTRDVVLSMADPRVRYVRRVTRSGPSAARNSGIRESRGEYLAFLDSDDTWAPRKVEAQVQLFEENPRGFEGLGLVLTAEETIEEATGRRIAQTWPGYRGYVYERFFTGEVGGNRTLMVRRECVERAGGFDENLPASELWDFMVRIARFYAFDYVPEVLAAYHVHGGPHAWVPENIARARVLLMEKYGRDVPNWRAFHSQGHRTIGVYRLQQGDVREARRRFGKALLIMPDHRTAAYLALTWMPGLYRTLRKWRERRRGGLRARAGA